MCGLLALITPIGFRPGLDRAAVERMRDTLAHRGPDGAGYLDRGSVVFAHRRLAVIDPTPGGHQPMVSADGRFALVYNGELYNDAELRRALRDEAFEFRTDSDTETVLAAIATWGLDAIPRLRGMFALCLHDAVEHRVFLARDPLGIKPLYFWRSSSRGSARLVVASEIAAILAHPELAPRPDLPAVSAYLTTIRTTIGDRTLFEGVRTLEPGDCLAIDLRSNELSSKRSRPEMCSEITSDEPEATRRVVEESIRAHLRSDVPICALLSGGLDSTITATVARSEVPELFTYCAGARGEADAAGDAEMTDLEAARRVAALLGTTHAEAIVTRELFVARWQELVDQSGVPLSTPNEVAINEVARCLRADGKVVTISGEGADELFGGYDILLGRAARFESSLPVSASVDGAARARAEFQARDAAWIPVTAKSAILTERAARGCEGDEVLLSTYENEFKQLADGPGAADPLRVHLGFHRRINLAGLLLRLDSAAMRAGVEGRTPFADVRVAGLAERLPMSRKFVPGGGVTGTKVQLREAFRHLVPEFVQQRAKASFPLPFQAWCAGPAGLLARLGAEREFFSDACLETVRSRPAELWSVAWPVLNIALWARRWWG